MLVYTAIISAVVSVVSVFVTFVYFKKQLNKLKIVSEEE